MKTLKTIMKVAFCSVFMMSLFAKGTSVSEVSARIHFENKNTLKKEVEKIIVSYVEDYKTDRHAKEKRIIGIKST